MITIKTDTDFYVLFTFLADDTTFATGLTPTIDIYEVGGSQVVTAQSMTEIAKGGYFYLMDADDITADKQYYVAADGGATLTTYRYQSGAFAGNFGNENTIKTIDGKVDTIDGIVDAVLVDTGTTIPATLATIDTNVDSIENVVGAINTLVQTNLDAKVSYAGSGNGDIAVNFTLKNTTTNKVVPGTRIWLSSDSAGSNLVTSTAKATNDEGVVFWSMASGVYYVWVAGRADYIGSLTIVSDTDQTFVEND